MAKLTGSDTFDEVVSAGAPFPIDLEILAGSSSAYGTQDQRFIHVDTSVNVSLGTTWVSGKGYGILNTVEKANQYYSTPYFAILNEGSIVNTNSTSYAGAGGEAHNAIFLWKGGSVTNASGAILEQTSADDSIGTVHFAELLSFQNSLHSELYNDGTIRSGLIAVSNWKQFKIENSGTIEGNIYSINGVYSDGKTSSLINSGNITGKHVGTSTSDIAKQTAVYIDDRYVEITNTGNITASGHFGIRSSGSSRIDLDNSGSIESATYGVYLLGGGAIDNSGEIEAKMGMAFGLTNNPTEKSITITNSGIIKGTTADAIWGSILETVDITNTEDGQIVSEGAGSGISLRGLNGSAQSATIENAGLIEGTTGIYLVKTDGATAQDLTVKNSGTISAHSSTGTAISSQADTKVSLEMQAGGQLVGGISALGSIDDLSFTGTGEIDGAVTGMETVTIETSAQASIAGDLSGFVTATVNDANLAVGGALTGATITLTGGRLELSGSAASSITTFVADGDSELHINNLTAAGTISADSVSIDGVKLTVGSSLEAALTLIEIDGNTTTATGTFEGLAEGATLAIGSSAYSISYVGGDGNDIVLTKTPTSGGGGKPTPSPEVPVVVDVLPDTGEPVVASPEAEIFMGTEAADMVVFSGNRSDYVITRNDDGTFTVKGQHAPDALNSIERLQFDDGVLALDVDANPGLAFRLYLAAFSRDPDFEGLGYWVRQLDSDTVDISAVAESFINSPEFERTYGRNDSLSNQQFVELLYLNTLARDFDQSGYEYWLEKLDSGATNRADLLVFFADSQESREITADTIADGIWMI